MAASRWRRWGDGVRASQVVAANRAGAIRGSSDGFAIGALAVS